MRRSALCLTLLIVITACSAEVGAPSGPAAGTAAESAAAAATAVIGTATPAAPPPTTAAATPGTARAPGGDTSPADLAGSVATLTSGKYVADLGFRPRPAGFGFENYGDGDFTDLTAAELQRMFGPQVCAGRKGATCLLTPAARQWMEEANKMMAGGHCEGFAVLSLLFHLGKARPADFGAPATADLKLAGNAKLQRELAYWFATQLTSPAADGPIEEAPSKIVQRLRTSLARGAAETYTVGVTKRDGGGGHAVTPFALEDRGDGRVWILVYDNNFPLEPRAIEVDTRKDTWRYFASTNPSEPGSAYEGDASTLSLTLHGLTPRLTAQQCPFCAGASSLAAGGHLAQATQRYNEVWLVGNASMYVSDAQGRRHGTIDGRRVAEIPGVTSRLTRSGASLWQDDPAPLILVPVGTAFTIVLDGARLSRAETVDVAVVGPGHDVAVEGIKLRPGERDEVQVSSDMRRLTYRTSGVRTPTLVIGLETSGADIAFEASGLLERGALTLALDVAAGRIELAAQTGAKSDLDVTLARITADDEEVFEATGIDLGPRDVLRFGYGKWRGNGTPLELEIDRGGDGTVDEVFEVADAR